MAPLQTQGNRAFPVHVNLMAVNLFQLNPVSGLFARIPFNLHATNFALTAASGARRCCFLASAEDAWRYTNWYYSWGGSLV